MTELLLPAAQQHTLKGVITYAGRGLHSGQHVALWLKPAPAGSGIVFQRKDVTQFRTTIPAHWENVISGRLCSVLGNAQGVTVATVEHLLAALRACGVDNALVEVNGPEIPILDGSAAPFVELIRHVGTEAQSAPRRFIYLTAAVTVTEGDRFAMLIPASHAQISVEIYFPSHVIGHQRYSVALDSDDFLAGIVPARTFGFTEEIAALREQGLARGGSLTNAVVVDNGQVVNAGSLRYENEFVRHKILDAVGDLVLAGAPVIAHYYGHKAGHRLNHLLLRELFARRQVWQYLDADALREQAHRLEAGTNAPDILLKRLVRTQREHT
jgi:UDP-3-O-[3-hydroxymyristoyl] N-acetylglucosamine deacetylase